MTFGIRQVFLLIAVIFFALAAVWSPPEGIRVNLLGVGLAFFALGVLVG